MKISLDGLKKKLELAEKERISEFENKSIEFIQSGGQRVREKNERDCGTISNIHVI